MQIFVLLKIFSFELKNAFDFDQPKFQMSEKIPNYSKKNKSCKILE